VNTFAFDAVLLEEAPRRLGHLGGDPHAVGRSVTLFQGDSFGTAQHTLTTASPARRRRSRRG
jgi:hypothetical protein